MKTRLSFTLLACFLVCAIGLRADDILTLFVDTKDSEAKYYLLGKRVSAEDIERDFGKLASLSKAVPVYIRLDENAKVADLLKVSAVVSKAGLTNQYFVVSSTNDVVKQFKISDIPKEMRFPVPDDNN